MEKMRVRGGGGVRSGGGGAKGTKKWGRKKGTHEKQSKHAMYKRHQQSQRTKRNRWQPSDASERQVRFDCLPTKRLSDASVAVAMQIECDALAIERRKRGFRLVLDSMREAGSLPEAIDSLLRVANVVINLMTAEMERKGALVLMLRERLAVATARLEKKYPGRVKIIKQRLSQVQLRACGAVYQS